MTRVQYVYGSREILERNLRTARGDVFARYRNNIESG
jgi:hypothetical protein